MNRYCITSFVAAAGLLAALPAAFAAPASPAAPAAPAATGARVFGQVTAVSGKTITLQDMRSQAATKLHVTDATKYLVDVPGSITDVKAGQTIRVMGQTDGTTVNARMIQIVPPEEANLPMGRRPGGRARPAGGGGQGGGQRGGGRRGVQGVVATVTPNLTITTADKQTDTVNAGTATRVMTSRDGTLADVKADENVTALTTGTGDNIVATLVHVRPAGGFGRRGGAPGNGQ